MVLGKDIEHNNIHSLHGDRFELIKRKSLLIYCGCQVDLVNFQSKKIK